MFGAAKDQRQFVAVLVQQFDQQIGLGLLRHEMHRLLDLIHRFAGCVHLDPNRIGQERGGQFGHLFWHGGRKQHGLA